VARAVVAIFAALFGYFLSLTAVAAALTVDTLTVDTAQTVNKKIFCP
jgi:hypothetical protein